MSPDLDDLTWQSMWDWLDKSAMTSNVCRVQHLLPNVLCTGMSLKAYQCSYRHKHMSIQTSTSNKPFWLLCILFLLDVIRHVILTVTVTVTNSNQFTTMNLDPWWFTYDPNDELNKLLVTLRLSSVRLFGLIAPTGWSGPGCWLGTRLVSEESDYPLYTLPLISWHTLH